MAEIEPKLISARVENGVLVVTFEGPELQDEKTALELQNELSAAVDGSGIKFVALDLGKVRYISSVAFRPLLHLRRTLNERAGALVLCNLSKIVGDVFYTTRMARADGSASAPFVMEADSAAAVARLERIARGSAPDFPAP